VAVSYRSKFKMAFAIFLFILFEVVYCQQTVGMYNNHSLILNTTDSRNHCFVKIYIHGVIEMRGRNLTTSYWLHVEIGKNIKTFYVKK
jgi:hypothetical protein